jgi:hypothetical protein
MKKTFYVILLTGFMIPVTAICQLEQGDLMNPFSAGGTFSHKSDRDFDEKTNDFLFTLNDGLGMFVIDKLAVGPGLTFQLENNHRKMTAQDGEATENTFSYSILFSPFVRYYFAKSGKLNWFVQGTGIIGYTHDVVKTTYHGNEYPTYKYGLFTYGGGASAGFSFFFNDNIALETALGYTFQGYTNKWVSSDNTNYYHSNISTLVLNVGLNFFIQP